METKDILLMIPLQEFQIESKQCFVAPGGWHCSARVMPRCQREIHWADDCGSTTMFTANLGEGWETVEVAHASPVKQWGINLSSVSLNSRGRHPVDPCEPTGQTYDLSHQSALLSPFRQWQV